MRDQAMTRGVPLGFGTAALLAVAFSVVAHPLPRLSFNPSPSAARGWYLVVPADGVPELGEQVLAWPPAWARRLAAERGYVPANVPLLKRIAARSGNRVCRNGAQLSVDGKVVAIAARRDRSGRPMPRWQGCHVLTDRTLLILAEHRPDSFDGRYFRLVDASAVFARARPLWTW